MPCECQVGLSCFLLGIVFIVGACAFAFVYWWILPAFYPIGDKHPNALERWMTETKLNWYVITNLVFFGLGFLLCGYGCCHECIVGWEDKKKLAAREISQRDEPEEAPTPYIMITE